MDAFCVRSLLVVMLAVIVDGPVPMYGQEASSQNAAVGTVVVKQLQYFGHGVSKWIEIPGTKAAGFSTDDCDFVTAFDVLVEYDRSRDWYVGKEKMTLRQRSVIRRVLEVSIGGKIYGGALRKVGVFPMDLNLACIDLEDASAGTSRIHHLYVDDSPQIPDFAMPPAVTEGTPILNEKGYVSSVYIPDTRDSSSFISGSDILKFLDEARKVPRSRSLLPKL